MLLVQIHALGATPAMWEEASGLLGGETLSPALFGIGDVPRHGGPPGLEDHADFLAPVIAALGRLVVMSGCAIGGMVAAAVAARLGAQVRGLVLANPILRITEPAGEALRARAARARAGGIGAIEEEVLDRAFDGLEIPAQRAAFGRHLRGISGDAYADLAEGIFGADIGAALERLTCPVLLVPGGRDVVLPGWHVDEIVALTGAEVRPAPSGGHFMPQQAPEEYAAAVAPFLGRL
ncbi:MAG: alpha/beta fold hydrolase [Pseudooceanicola sp.]|nr:alpha/beta fold hydrolase [Pseudooceanicola sp.]